MSCDTRNEFALAMQRLRSDRYITRQFNDELRSIETAYDRAQATIKESLTVAHPAPAGGGAGDALAGWIADGDTIPAELIDVTRDAIRREFGNNGTDGYYKRILVKIFAALTAKPGAEG